MSPEPASIAMSPEPWEVPFEDGEDSNKKQKSVEFCTPLPKLAKPGRVARQRSVSTPAVFDHDVSSTQQKKEPEKEEEPPISILDCILQQEDEKGAGLTQAVTTEICILLWMMMDAGNAWTAMALNLLSLDQTACHRVQQELDHLISIHGKSELFTPEVLSRMTTLDALLYEAIRLCPSFLGGMKIIKQTTEFEDIGLQIPKDSHVIFCQPTEERFDMSKAMGKKPEDLGDMYPSCEL